MKRILLLLALSAPVQADPYHIVLSFDHGDGKLCEAPGITIDYLTLTVSGLVCTTDRIFRGDFQ
jgi:hypothetical protein